jgi:hypothetical protein
MACRGTGRVISHLGGSPSTVECPWCEGSGLRPAEIDAQSHLGTPAEPADPAPSAPPAAESDAGSEPGQHGD